MFCSIVIPTIGRSSLSRAVRSVLDQAFDQDNAALPFEVIVVNDSGAPLPMDETSSSEEWLRSDRVRVLHTQRRERCVARNTGAAVAKGQYLCFLDDDDWLLPNALADLGALARQNPDAVWLYGGIRVVDAEDRCLAELNSGLNGNCFAQILGGAWAPIQASLIQTRAFFSVGGYDPALLSTQDLDLCSRIAARGDLANTPTTVACLFRGQTWNTSTNYLRAPDYIRHSRDQVLSEPGAFSRLLRSSAQSRVDSDYWYGRIFRVYLSVVLWNLRRKRLFTAMSRAVYTAAWFGVAGSRGRGLPHVFSPGFWQAAKAHHARDTLHFVLEREDRKSAAEKGRNK